MEFWILSGATENWQRAFEENLWGVKRKSTLISRWKGLSEEDVLAFYCTSPINGIIGFGKAKQKFKSKTPLWPDEIKEDRVIYPLRFKIKITYILSDWKADEIDLFDLKLPYQAGMNRVKSKEEFKKLLKRCEESWDTDLLDLIPEIKEKKRREIEKRSLHDRIKYYLKEMGELEDFISEKEHPLDGRKVDAAWKKVEMGTPSHVFEVHVKGDLVRELSKLKHASDIWPGSKIFLVTAKKERQKVKKLLEGTFHEIKKELKILPIDEIEKLYNSQKESRTLKKAMGLIE